MKKYLAVLLGVLIFSPALFAEITSFNVKDVVKDYSTLIPNLVKENGIVPIYVKKSSSNQNYITKQYIPYELDEINEESETPESKITNGYEKVSITVPVGYKIQDYILTNTYGQLSFPNSKSILLLVNGKEVRFQLDYTIKFTDKKYQKYFEENFYDVDLEKVSQPMTITIKYSPRYFTLKSYKKSYSGTKTLNITYEGKNIALNTRVYHFMEIDNKHGKPTYFVLEPNYQNIYNDFKFVRESKIRPLQ